jgi:GWxTD domain-containing protein
MLKARTGHAIFGLGLTLFSVLAIAAAAAAAAIPKKDVWYTQHYVIMQDFERKLYRDLTEEGRKGFQQLFWAARKTNARVLFDARMEFVMKNYKTENSKQPWNTDRGRILLLNGPPASIDYDQNLSFSSTMLPGQTADSTSRSGEDVAANRAEVWTYPFDKYFIRYVFYFVQPNQWRITQTTGSHYLGDLENYNKTVTFGIVDEAQYKLDLAALPKTK